MIRYILWRLAVLPLSLFIVSALTFSFLQLIPGDAIDVLGADSMTDEARDLLRERYGLNDPLPVQFFVWLSHVLQGDLGTSISTQRPVLQEVLERVPVTVELAVIGIVMALTIGIIMGAIATRWRRTWVEAVTLTGSTLGMSTPNYFAATMFVLCISLYFPTIGVVSYVPLETSILGNIASLLIPAFSLAILPGATFCQYVRGATEDVLRNADFVRTARSKGASERRILTRHVLPNAMLPVVTAAGLQFASLLGGTIVIETIFALPGLGRLLISGIALRDYTVVQGCVLLQGCIFVVINLIVDLLYPILDPRVRVASN